MQRDMDNLVRNRDEQNSIIEQSQKIQQQLQQEKLEFQKKCLSLEKQTYELEKELMRLQSDKAIEEGYRERQEVNQKIIEKFEKDIVKLKMDHSSEIDAYEKDIQQMKSTINGYKLQNEQLIGQLRNIQEQAYQKDSQYQQFRTNNMEYENKLAQMIQENTTLNETNRRNGIEIENLKDAILSLKDRTERELKSRDQLENQLQDKIESFNQEIKQLQI